MDYETVQCPMQYVENGWDDFLTEKANGDRVRYFKYYRLFPCDATTEPVIRAFKKLQMLEADVIRGKKEERFGRTFFNISYKIVDGFAYGYYSTCEPDYTSNEEYVKRHYPNNYKPCKLVSFNLKIASFADDQEKDFVTYPNSAISALEKRILSVFCMSRFEKCNSALTKVKDKDDYIKKHPLTDKYGVVIDIGDLVATGSGAGVVITKVAKLTPTTVNYGMSPKNCIVVRAADPNKKLGW